MRALTASSGLHLALLLGLSFQVPSKQQLPPPPVLAVREVLEAEYLDTNIPPLGGSEMPAKVEPRRAPGDSSGVAQYEHLDTLERRDAGQRFVDTGFATEARAPARLAVPTARFALVAESYGSRSDTRLSLARVSTAAPALQHASTLGGSVGLGAAGALTPGAPGIGELDPILGQYLQRLRRSVDWGHAFPTWAVAEGRGGIAIVRMTILANGRLAELQLLRASGVEEFDQNLVVAIRRAAPFAPIPAALGRASLALNFSFDATNPAVGRDGNGPGGRRSEALANIP